MSLERVCSLVGCASACLHVPLSWQVEPSVQEVPHDVLQPPVAPPHFQVTLQSLQNYDLLFVHTVQLAGTAARVLFDTGATHSFIDNNFAAKHKLSLSKPIDCGVTMGDGHSVSATRCTTALPLHFQGKLTTTVPYEFPVPYWHPYEFIF
jgi:hypothetical protein